MGKLTDSFTALATRLTPDSRRDDAQKFTRTLRNIATENTYFNRMKGWLGEKEKAELGDDGYLKRFKDNLGKTGFDMSKWDSLESAIDTATHISGTGAMQRALQDDTASAALVALTGEKDNIAEAVKATNKQLAPARDRIAMEIARARASIPMR